MSRGGRWIRDSVINNERRRTSAIFDSLRKVNESFIVSQKKQVFFPSSESSKLSLETSSRYTIDCDCIAKIFWDILVMIVTIMISYYTPYSISFYSGLGKTPNIVVSSLYILDVALSFNTSYYSKGFLVENRYKIAKHYFKHNFFPDLLSSFPYEFLFFDYLEYDENYPVYTDLGSRPILRYLMLLKLLRLFRYQSLIFNLRELFPYPAFFTVLSIFSYLFWASLSLHILACFQNVLYMNSLFITHENYQNVYYDNKTRYIKLVMRTMETITSVGYGEFPIRTNLERLFSIFIMTLTSGMFGYYVGGIQSFIEKSNQVNLYFNDIMRKTKVYMRIHKCPISLRNRVNNYFRNLKKLHSENLLKEQDILSLLSAPMKEEVFSRIQGHYLLRIKEFRRISTACLKAISDNLNLLMFGPNDIIINQGELTSDLFFIVGGTVEVFHRQTKTMYKLLGSQYYFGEISFFCGTPRSASVKSFDYCELLSFHSLDFKRILNNHPRDKEIIEVFVRNVGIYGVSIMGIRCYLCDDPGHFALNCKKSIFIRDKLKIIEKKTLIPRPKNRYEMEDKQYDHYKRYNIRNSKGNPNHINFNKSFFLNDAAKTYSTWLCSADKQTSGLINLMKSMEDIPEEEEDNDNSAESWEEMIGLHFSKTQKIQTTVLEACDSLSPISCLKRSRAILNVK